MPSIPKFIERMDYWCRVASLGYCWAHRHHIYDGGAADCSSLVIHCLEEAGFDVGDAINTENLSRNLTARGWQRLAPDIASVRPGDILLNDAAHVAVVIAGEGWGATIAQASIAENGSVYCGQLGDQTGNETNERPVYSYPWDCILRYPAPQPAPKPAPKPKEVNVIPVSNEGGMVYRLIDPDSARHHFTASAAERDGLSKHGWKLEGEAWMMPEGGTVPVWRLFLAGDHLLTASYEEAKKAEKAGYKAECVPFFGLAEGGTPVWRLFNPSIGEHFYTASTEERDALKARGWNDEGIAFRAL